MGVSGRQVSGSVSYAEARPKWLRVFPPLDLSRPELRACARPSVIWRKRALDLTASSGDIGSGPYANWGMLAHGNY
jgi:hypothetical protein